MIKFLTNLFLQKSSLFLHLLIVAIISITLFKLKTNDITIIHHLLLLIGGISFYISISLVFKTSSKTNSFFHYIFYLLIVAEILLSFFSTTLFNEPEGHYLSPYSVQKSNIYWKREPNVKIALEDDEYNFERKTNSLGFSDREWTKDKPKGLIRILCLGDSFTEGDGADSDSTYPRYLERSIQNAEVLNAGISGSDPFFDFKKLKDILISYQPDIVLQSFSVKDFKEELIFRGGNERFINDSTLQYREHVRWEKLYALSYLSRILIRVFGGYDYFLIPYRKHFEIYNEMETKTISLFKEYKDYTEKNGAYFVLFNHTYKFNFNDTTSLDFIKHFKSLLIKHNIEFYDLQPCYEKEIEKANKNYKDYYWIDNGHHNAKGYEMMAKCIKEIILPVIEKSTLSQL